MSLLAQYLENSGIRESNQAGADNGTASREEREGAFPVTYLPFFAALRELTAYM